MLDKGYAKTLTSHLSVKINTTCFSYIDRPPLLTGSNNSGCAALKTSVPGVGLWLSLNCASTAGYVCEYPRSGFSTPLTTTTTTTAPLVCPSGWNLYSGYCYKVFETFK